jgi:hypothetical protein
MCVDVVAQGFYQSLRRPDGRRTATTTSAETRPFSGFGGGKEGDVVAKRPPRSTRRTAIDARRSHSVKKEIIGGRISLEDGLPRFGFVHEHSDFLKSI